MNIQKNLRRIKKIVYETMDVQQILKSIKIKISIEIFFKQIL